MSADKITDSWCNVAVVQWYIILDELRWIWLIQLIEADRRLHWITFTWVMFVSLYKMSLNAYFIILVEELHWIGLIQLIDADRGLHWIMFT